MTNPLDKVKLTRWQFTYGVESRQFKILKDDCVHPLEQLDPHGFVLPIQRDVVKIIVYAATEQTAVTQGFLKTIDYLFYSVTQAKWLEDYLAGK